MNTYRNSIICNVCWMTEKWITYTLVQCTHNIAAWQEEKNHCNGFFLPWKLCHQIKYCREIYHFVFCLLFTQSQLGHSWHFFLLIKIHSNILVNEIQHSGRKKTYQLIFININNKELIGGWINEWMARWLSKSIEYMTNKVIWHWLNWMTEFALSEITVQMERPIYFYRFNFWFNFRFLLPSTLFLLFSIMTTSEHINIFALKKT